MFLKKLFLIFAILFGLSSTIEAKRTKNINYTSYYIESIAKSMLGKRYKWGGNGPYRYDCSGFTKEVFERNGIKIPRLSKEQAQVGKKVKKSQLQKGDLVFFHSKGKQIVDHVGIYLGRGKFIHASKFHKQIVISPLREYIKLFKWGRRVTS
jgi:cell wall-associated NlpC family hydrolase